MTTYPPRLWPGHGSKLLTTRDWMRRTWDRAATRYDLTSQSAEDVRADIEALAAVGCWPFGKHN